MQLDLEYEGFYLSPIVDGDQDAYLEHFADQATCDSLLLVPFPYTREDADKWIAAQTEIARKQSRVTQFALRRSNGYLIGGVGLILASSPSGHHRAELGYWISRPYRGKGLATRCAQRLIHYAFDDLGRIRVEAHVSLDNLASQKVLTKVGLKKEGLMAAYHFKKGRPQDALLYAVVRPAASQEPRSTTAPSQS